VNLAEKRINGCFNMTETVVYIYSKEGGRMKSCCQNRPYSSQVVDGTERAASRAMLHAVGFKRSDFSKPQVGIASTWSMVTVQYAY
jgi:hypothetical protein